MPPAGVSGKKAGKRRVQQQGGDRGENPRRRARPECLGGERSARPPEVSSGSAISLGGLGASW